MSHDIRTPMNAVIGLAQLGMDECTDPTADEYFHKINSSGTYLLGLLNDILDMSKIESGKIEFHEEIIDSKKYFDSIITMLTPMFESKHIRLVTDFSGMAVPYVYCDKLRVKQIFSNLLNNAVKFSEPDSKVEWSVRDVRRENDVIYFEVKLRDYGCGMSDDFQKKMFDPFTQEKNSYSNKNASTGLGLAICKNLIEQMGGTISVESKLGEGTTFTINMHHKISDKPPETQTITELKTNDFKGKRILLAEDHPINREIATKLLVKKGISVTVAVNGRKAVELFSENEPFYFSAILMDIRMPEMDGIEATKHIRKLDRSDSKSTPIIALSANAFDEDKKQCLDAGMNSHLAKPINPEELFDVLGKFIK